MPSDKHNLWKNYSGVTTRYCGSVRAGTQVLPASSLQPLVAGGPPASRCGGQPLGTHSSWPA
jgi:hypothetical protein